MNYSIGTPNSSRKEGTSRDIRSGVLTETFSKNGEKAGDDIYSSANPEIAVEPIAGIKNSGIRPGVQTQGGSEKDPAKKVDSPKKTKNGKPAFTKRLEAKLRRNKVKGKAFCRNLLTKFQTEEALDQAAINKFNLDLPPRDKSKPLKCRLPLVDTKEAPPVGKKATKSKPVKRTKLQENNVAKNAKNVCVFCGPTEYSIDANEACRPCRYEIIYGKDSKIRKLSKKVFGWAERFRKRTKRVYYSFANTQEVQDLRSDWVLWKVTFQNRTQPQVRELKFKVKYFLERAGIRKPAFRSMKEYNDYRRYNEECKARLEEHFAQNPQSYNNKSTQCHNPKPTKVTPSKSQTTFVSAGSNINSSYRVSASSSFHKDSFDSTEYCEEENPWNTNPPRSERKCSTIIQPTVSKEYTFSEDLLRNNWADEVSGCAMPQASEGGRKHERDTNRSSPVPERDQMAIQTKEQDLEENKKEVVTTLPPGESKLDSEKHIGSKTKVTKNIKSYQSKTIAASSFRKEKSFFAEGPSAKDALQIRKPKSAGYFDKIVTHDDSQMDHTATIGAIDGQKPNLEGSSNRRLNKAPLTQSGSIKSTGKEVFDSRVKNKDAQTSQDTLVSVFEEIPLEREDSSVKSPITSTVKNIISKFEWKVKKSSKMNPSVAAGGSLSPLSMAANRDSAQSDKQVVGDFQVPSSQSTKSCEGKSKFSQSSETLTQRDKTKDEQSHIKSLPTAPEKSLWESISMDKDARNELILNNQAFSSIDHARKNLPISLNGCTENLKEDKFVPCGSLEERSFQVPTTKEERKQLEEKLWNMLGNLKDSFSELKGKHELADLEEVLDNFMIIFEFSRANFTQVNSNQVKEYTRWLENIRELEVAALDIVSNMATEHSVTVQLIKNSDKSQKSLHELEKRLMTTMTSLKNAMSMMKEVQNAIRGTRKGFKDYVADLTAYAITNKVSRFEILEMYDSLCRSGLKNPGDKSQISDYTGYDRYMEDNKFLMANDDIDYDRIFGKSLDELQAAHDAIMRAKEDVEGSVKTILSGLEKYSA